MTKLPGITLLVRWLLGVQLCVNGLNWCVKMLPFPNAYDPPGMPMKFAVVGAMLETGWMFPLSKLIELLTGLALLLDVFVPLMLVVSFPVVLSAFMFDAFIFGAIAAWFAGSVTNGVVVAKILDMIFFGGAVLTMQVYLMFCYLPYYRPLLSARARTGEAVGEIRVGPGQKPGRALGALGILALILGTLSTAWLVGMIGQWAIPWSSLAVLAPPR